MDSDCGKSWEAIIQGDAPIIGGGGEEATFRVWSGEAYLNEMITSPRHGKIRRSWQRSWKVTWKRRFLIWAMKGESTVLPLAHSESFLGYWVKRRM